MKISLKLALAASTALIAFVQPVVADPVSISLAAAATIAGGAATAAIAGTAIVWSAVLGQAAVAGVLAGISSALAPKQRGGKTAQEITLNRITPVTSGLIVYGKRMLGGSIVARSTTASSGKKNRVYHSIIPLACHEIDGVEEIYWGETKVWSQARYDTDEAAGTDPTAWWGLLNSRYDDKLFFRVYTGTEDQQAEPIYVAAAPEWRSTARGLGVAYLYVRAVFDIDLFPRGVQQVRALVRGKKVYDPRSEETVFSSNPALHVRDYALTPELLGGVGLSEDRIDDDAIIALANVADEEITLAGGGTEARYEFNGVLDTEASPQENLDRLTTSWGGWRTFTNGKLTVGGGSFESPSVTITEDDMVAPMRVRARRPFEDQFNLVKAVYADPDQEYVPSDLPVLQSATYRAQDNGEELVRDLGELYGETSFARAQRLMKLILLKGRRQKSVDVVCNLSKIGVGLGDNINLTVPRRGWTNKTFEVTGKTISIAPGNVNVSFSLIESGPEVFDWTTSEELAKPAGGVPTLATPDDRPAVTVPTVSESLYQTRGGGGIKTRVRLTSETDSPFLETYQFSWRRLDVPGDEIILPVTRDNFVSIDDFAPGTYVFGARGATYRGATAPWVYTPPAEIFGLNAEPASLSGLTGSVVSGLLTLRWREHPDIDVRQGGVIEVRHSSRTDATWQTSTSIGAVVPGSSRLTTVPAISGRYLLRPVDARGIAGPISTLDTTAPDFMDLSIVDEVTEDDTFTGTKTDCTVESGALALDAGELSATYEFAGEMDFGSVRTVRLSARLSARISDRSDLFDSAEFFDSPALFDGDGDAEGDVQVFYSASQVVPDDFGPWVEFDRTDVTARKLKFKAEMTARSTQFKTEILDLGARAEAPT